jgi:hypothetical protein
LAVVEKEIALDFLGTAGKCQGIVNAPMPRDAPGRSYFASGPAQQFDVPEWPKQKQDQDQRKLDLPQYSG